jgi:glycosyltransferase involved in cell wall biosynthesis
MAARILHVIAELGIGGAETVVLDLVRQGPTVGWASAVASSGGARVPLLDEAGAEHFHVPLVGRAPLRVPVAAARLRSAFHRFRPDVVVAHNISSSLVTWTASMAGGPSRGHLVSVFHGVDQQDLTRAAKFLDRFPGRVVAVSSSTRDGLLARGLRRADVVVIPNAVTVARLPDRDVARGWLGISPDVPVALCLARLRPQKRVDVLLRAWSTVSPGALLLVAGDGPLRPQLEVLAQQLGIAGTTRFLGECKDVAALLAAADVGVLSSDWEGLPLAALESMAAGLPMVATAVDGLAELVGDREGRLVPPGDAGALGRALAEMLFDAPRRRAAGDAARELVRRRHDPSVMVDRYASLFSKEMATSPRRGGLPAGRLRGNPSLRGGGGHAHRSHRRP